MDPGGQDSKRGERVGHAPSIGGCAIHGDDGGDWSGNFITIEEAFTEIGGWNQTEGALTEPAIAVAGDKVVETIADSFGEDACDGEERPREPETTRDSNGGIHAGVDFVVVDQDHAVGHDRGGFGRGDGVFGGLRLERGKLEESLGIMLDDPSDGSVAEVACAIKEKDGRVRMVPVGMGSVP